MPSEGRVRPTASRPAWFGSTPPTRARPSPPRPPCRLRQEENSRGRAGFSIVSRCVAIVCLVAWNTRKFGVFGQPTTCDPTACPCSCRRTRRRVLQVIYILVRCRSNKGISLVDESAGSRRWDQIANPISDWQPCGCDQQGGSLAAHRPPSPSAGAVKFPISEISQRVRGGADRPATSKRHRHENRRRAARHAAGGSRGGLRRLG